MSSDVAGLEHIASVVGSDRLDISHNS